MKNRLLFINLFLLLLMNLFEISALGDTNKPCILVVPFENLSGQRSMAVYEVGTSNNPSNTKRKFTIDRYSEIPRSITEDILVSFGVDVVERQRLDQLLLEQDFIRLSGLVDTSNAIKLGRLLGANIVLVGTINNIHSKRKTFSGYGIRRTSIIIECSIRIRLINIQSGKIIYSKTLHGTDTYDKSNFGNSTDNDTNYSVIEKTLNKLKNNSDLKMILSEK